MKARLVLHSDASDRAVALIPGSRLYTYHVMMSEAVIEENRLEIVMPLRMKLVRAWLAQLVSQLDGHSLDSHFEISVAKLAWNLHSLLQSTVICEQKVCDLRKRSSGALYLTSKAPKKAVTDAIEQLQGEIHEDEGGAGDEDELTERLLGLY